MYSKIKKNEERFFLLLLFFTIISHFEILTNCDIPPINSLTYGNVLKCKCLFWEIFFK